MRIIGQIIIIIMMTMIVPKNYTLCRNYSVTFPCPDFESSVNIVLMVIMLITITTITFSCHWTMLFLLLALFSQYCVYDDNPWHHHHCHVFLSLNYAAFFNLFFNDNPDHHYDYHIFLSLNYTAFCLVGTVLNLPSKHAGSDLEEFWLWPVMAVTASVQPELARIVYTGSDFPHQFWFNFSKEGMEHIAQNWPGSYLDGPVRVWPNASGLEASCAGIIGTGFWQDTTSFPLSDSVPYFHRRPG